MSAGPAIRRRRAFVKTLLSARRGLVELEVAFGDGGIARAIAYTDLVGAVAVGNEVLLNTTAVELSLGTGGVHFVVSVLNPAADSSPDLPGHLLKLRYTPHQCAVACAEESEPRAANGQEDLRLTPVVACELHSQVPAVAGGFLARRPGSRVVYVMTDGAALPLPFSRLVFQMKESGLLTHSISSGQSFGGDLEAINIYSALLVARHTLKADLIVVGQGPGNAGTATSFGFSGIQQGEAANAAASLGGRAIVVLRASAADPRPRHQTPSHHTLTVLDRVVRCRCLVPIARDVSASRRRAIRAALCELELHERHHLVDESRGAGGLSLLEERGVHVSSMGRSIQQDREFFLHASAAGDAAAATLDLRGEV